MVMGEVVMGKAVMGESKARKTAKTALRRHLLAQRSRLSAGEWRDRSHKLCHQILRQPRFQASNTILAYFSFRQEPDLSELWRSHPDKTWAFPRCVGPALQWHRWQPGEPLGSGAYGIQEPAPTAAAIAPRSADLILVPAVGCDVQGHRLGYGGGYYDRALSLPGMQQIPTVGIVFDFALLPELPQDPWDHPLDAVCSELRWIERSRSHVEGQDKIRTT